MERVESIVSRTHKSNRRNSLSFFHMSGFSSEARLSENSLWNLLDHRGVPINKPCAGALPPGPSIVNLSISERRKDSRCVFRNRLDVGLAEVIVVR